MDEFSILTYLWLISPFIWLFYAISDDGIKIWIDLMGSIVASCSEITAKNAATKYANLNGKIQQLEP